ncbi:hypothetical protein TNIN_160001 [Trichonephila inaurata madagascariensis]|uniref:Uncharacterized protein n=1 Tax=Trichonephila inaurata madagascariensis TaxID=2747483 RepID=A0A8X7CJ22_9ARAC|nr:hypothetical protein TNIN_160001 [Trichonephila inaurata madagascariensis]
MIATSCHALLNGYVATFSIHTPEIVGVEIMHTNHRNLKKINQTLSYDRICSSNQFDPSSSEEYIGSFHVFDRFCHLKQLKYLSFYDDGNLEENSSVKGMHDKESLTKSQ